MSRHDIRQGRSAVDPGRPFAFRAGLRVQGLARSVQVWNASALALRLGGAHQPGFQDRRRQMPEEIGEAKLARIRLGKALHGIAPCIERGIKGFGARPGAAS